MDVLAHALWAGIGLKAWQRRHPVTRTAAALTVLLAVAPDAAQMLPVAWWSAWHGQWREWLAFAMAVPGAEPAMPPWVALWSHHLHCIFHSAPIAAGVTALVWAVRRAFWLPLAGWWSHIGIDVFTHSADFYPVPVLYPFTYAGFDGIAWNTPWFVALNYGALALVALWLWRRPRG